MKATKMVENGRNQELGRSEANDAAGAELALLRHLAMEGELALRRDQLAGEHQAVTERLIRARQARQALVQAVQDAGGKLPSWEA